jgi:hypothetical protein
VRNPIDRFILARLEKEGFRPSPAADRYTLLRRVSLDLTGLQPTPKEIREFVADKSPNAYEKVVDRLLASPHYGERWGRHWLDIARYADSTATDRRPRQWYRDWVIRSSIAISRSTNLRSSSLRAICFPMDGRPVDRPASSQHAKQPGRHRL